MLNENYNSSMICNEQKISFQDNTHTRINIYENRSTSSDPAGPLFLILPALGVRSDFYINLAFSMVNYGWNAVTLDWRGSGTSSVQVNRHSRFGFHEILSIDLPKIIREIKKIFPSNPLYIIGHSLGGQLALLYTSLHDQQVDGIILLTCGSNYYKNLKFPQDLIRLINYRLIKMFTSIFGYFPGNRLGFAGKESKNMIIDWLRESLTGKYKIINSPHDFEILLKTIDVPVLFMTLAGDKYVTAECACFLAEKLSQAKVSNLELTAADYKLPQFTHFNWKKTPGPIVKTIGTWLESV